MHNQEIAHGYDISMGDPESADGSWVIKKELEKQYSGEQYKIELEVNSITKEQAIEYSKQLKVKLPF